MAYKRPLLYRLLHHVVKWFDHPWVQLLFVAIIVVEYLINKTAHIFVAACGLLIIYLMFYIREEHQRNKTTAHEPICAYCKNVIHGTSISAAGKEFCSKLCHLKFWKEELPNLGGAKITDADIEKLEVLTGPEFDLLYSEIITRISTNFDKLPIFERFAPKQRPE